MNVCYTAPFEDASGYGEASRNYIRALHDAGVNVKTQKVTYTTNKYEGPNLELARGLSNNNIDYDFKIIHTTPDEYYKYYEKGKYNIGHLFWETTKLPNDWAKACNLVEEIWTSTFEAVDFFKESGVESPIAVFPQAINIDVPKPPKFGLPEFNGYLFYTVMEWTERKNPKDLLTAFWTAFKGESDVALLIKAHVGDYTAAGKKKIEEDLRNWKAEMPHKFLPRVFLYTDILDYEGIHQLHETGDAFVSLHRGEGWGLPQVEALVHKNNVISTGFGGVHEYLNKRDYYHVDYKLVDIGQHYNKYYTPGMKWAKPDIESARNHMRKIYDTYKDKGITRTRLKAYNGAKKARQLFNYKRVGTMLAGRMQDIENLEKQYG